jgi:hypothetical protein
MSQIQISTKVRMAMKLFQISQIFIEEELDSIKQQIVKSGTLLLQSKVIANLM